MNLLIYKGFEISFLRSLQLEPLVDCDIESKLNVLKYDKNTKKKLAGNLLLMDDEDSKWITYEEFSLIKTTVDVHMKDYGLKVKIIKNNIFPDYYQLPFDIEEELAKEIVSVLEEGKSNNVSAECNNYTSIYTSLFNVDGVCYASFNNYEYESDCGYAVDEYYPKTIQIIDSNTTPEIAVISNNDVETYLRDLNRIIKERPLVVGFKGIDGLVTTRIKNSLLAYCQKNNIKLVNYKEKIESTNQEEQELIKIAQEDIKIPGFTDFRKLRFYKNPDINNETSEISQSQIIREIIKQAESSYDVEHGNTFRDIFITASTGAGKSVMFQIPAVYLAKKHLSFHTNFRF